MICYTENDFPKYSVEISKSIVDFFTNCCSDLKLMKQLLSQDAPVQTIDPYQ